jgi:hypothetical protein
MLKCICSVLLIFCSATSFCQTSCNKAVIEALHTKYTYIGSGNIAQTAHDLVCNRSNGSLAGTYAGYGLDISAAQQECKKNDSSYWSQHSEAISLSFLPPEALGTVNSVCSSNNIQLSATQTGTNITLNAHFMPIQGGPYTAQIKALLYDKKGITCDLSDLRKTKTVGSGGTGIQCQRINGATEKEVFLLQTDRGAQTATIPALPAHYELWAWGGDDNLQCWVNGASALIIGGAESNRNSIEPVSKISLDSYARPGVNTLHCTSQNLHPDKAWYHYVLMRNGVAVNLGNDSNDDIGMGQLPPPPDITFSQPLDQP